MARVSGAIAPLKETPLTDFQELSRKIGRGPERKPIAVKGAGPSGRKRPIAAQGREADAPRGAELLQETRREGQAGALETSFLRSFVCR